MNNILYYDCFAGISGDMNLAALVDLGVDPAFLLNELGKLHIDEFEITFSKDMRRGISGTKAEVLIKGHEHTHEHPHENHHHSHLHSHKHRTFKDIKNLIRKSDLSEFVKDKSIAVFTKIAEAEGKIHNKPIDEVHFHEVGAVDSIVDITGAAICIEHLKPSRIIASSIELGSGMVKCEHGTFPVPAPATAEILKNIPVKSGNVPFEATTPTGAAILAVFADEFVDKHQFTLLKTGYGIGHKDSEVPNVLRVYWASTYESKFKTETAVVIECNIDDMNPEIYDYILEKLFKEGADDVYLSPVIMKKSRPANTISVLCNQNAKDKLINVLLSETSTIGVRSYDVVKHILEREIIELNTRLGKIKVKKSWMGNDIVKYKPEYDDCIIIAKERNIKLSEVIQIVQDEIQKSFMKQ
jgi:pyridinium-3,5-bisthiocarboxylic acid mononucleotide nickel chelatase